MADFPTFRDLFRVARDEVLARNSLLTRVIVEREGSDANALTAAGVSTGDATIGQLIRVDAALHLDSAKGEDLDRLVFDRYGLLRKPAVAASGTVQFTLPAPAASGFSIPAGTRLSTSDNIVFTTLTQVTFPSGSSGPISVNVQSVLAGLSQQAQKSTITSILSTIPGAAPSLAVTNALATVGAADKESDSSLRNRAKKFYTTAARGTLAAIQAGALAVLGVETATAFEVLDENGGGARLVEVVVADQFTEQLVDATVTPVAYQTQANTLANTVLAGLVDVRAAGIQVAVIVGVVQLIGVTLALRFKAGADVDATTAAAKAAIVNYTNSLAPGASFIVDDAQKALQTVPGLFVTGGEIVSPSGDVIPTALQVIRTSFGLVTVGSGLSQVA